MVVKKRAKRKSQYRGSKHPEGRDTSPLDLSADANGQLSQDRLLSAAYQFLTIANDMTNEEDTLCEFVDRIKKITKCEAVGIRVYDGENCLIYGAQDGYCDGFNETEGTLCLDEDHCLCTMVFNRQTDPTFTYFSPGGSFYINDSHQLKADSAIRQLGPLRGTCTELGYRSIGIFPVRSQDTILGLIHVADPRKDQMPPQMVLLLEKAALQLGNSIEKARALEALKLSHKELEWRVYKRTTELVEANRQLQQEMEQRKAADDRLDQHRKMLQRVFNGISDPLVLVDQKMNVQMINNAAQQYFGLEDSDHVLSKPCYEGLGRFSENCQTCPIPGGVLDGRHMELERKGFRSEERNEDVAVYPLKNHKGEVYGAVMQIRDVTDSLVMKEQLDQIQQQADLGMLVSSVAHEIKNPNSFIAFNISILKDYLADMLPILDRHAESKTDVEIGNMPYAEFREDVLKLVDTIELGAHRIDAFLANLREYSTAKTDIVRKKISLQSVLDKVLSLAGSKIRQSVRNFEIQIPEELPDIYSDPVILEQVLVNLLVNAAQAADKGNSWIKFRVHPIQTRDEHIILQLEDNGCGMDDQTRKKIFEPFYSTKIAEGGTGLGLYVCNNLVTQIDGRISVTSQKGKGSCFTLELPIRKSL